jgi:hypothetical protein
MKPAHIARHKRYEHLLFIAPLLPQFLVMKTVMWLLNDVLRKAGGSEDIG